MLRVIIFLKEKDKCPTVNLKSLREENINRSIFAQININSMKTKFQFPASQAINNTDVLFVSETKLYDSFQKAQFLLDGLSKRHRSDRCSNTVARLLTEHYQITLNAFLSKLNKE